MTDSERVAQIEKRLAAATPGPWTTEKPKKITEGPAAGWPDRAVIAGTVGGQGIYTSPGHKGGTFPAADCELIANAPADLAWLIEKLKRPGETP